MRIYSNQSVCFTPSTSPKKHTHRCISTIFLKNESTPIDFLFLATSVWNVCSIRSNQHTLTVDTFPYATFMRLFSSPLLFKQKHSFSPLRFCFHIAHQTWNIRSEWRSLRKLRTHGLQCGIPALSFFSTHCSRFLGISALCPGMSAKEEKSSFLESFLFSRPGGYTRITEALCKHTWYKP